MNKYEATIENGKAVISLSAQVLGGNDAVNFSQTLNDALKNDISKVIVDLSDVEVINSSGLGMLVSGMTTAKNHGKSIVLASVPDKVTNLLKMTHLDNVFQIFNSVQEAKGS